MWLTPPTGDVGAFTVNCVEDAKAVTVVGVVPPMLVGHGVPSTHPPPGPDGDAVGAAGSASRRETSTGWLAALAPTTAARVGYCPCTYGMTVPVISVEGRLRFLLVLD